MEQLSRGALALQRPPAWRGRAGGARAIRHGCAARRAQYAGHERRQGPAHRAHDRQPTPGRPHDRAGTPDQHPPGQRRALDREVSPHRPVSCLAAGIRFGAGWSARPGPPCDPLAGRTRAARASAGRGGRVRGGDDGGHRGAARARSPFHAARAHSAPAEVLPGPGPARAAAAGRRGPATGGPGRHRHHAHARRARCALCRPRASSGGLHRGQPRRLCLGPVRSLVGRRLAQRRPLGLPVAGAAGERRDHRPPGAAHRKMGEQLHHPAAVRRRHGSRGRHWLRPRAGGAGSPGAQGLPPQGAATRRRDAGPRRRNPGPDGGRTVRSPGARSGAGWAGRAGHRVRRAPLRAAFRRRPATVRARRQGRAAERLAAPAEGRRRGARPRGRRTVQVARQGNPCRRATAEAPPGTGHGAAAALAGARMAAALPGAPLGAAAGRTAGVGCLRWRALRRGAEDRRRRVACEHARRALRTGRRRAARHRASAGDGQAPGADVAAVRRLRDRPAVCAARAPHLRAVGPGTGGICPGALGRQDRESRGLARAGEMAMGIRRPCARWERRQLHPPGTGRPGRRAAVRTRDSRAADLPSSAQVLRGVRLLRQDGQGGAHVEFGTLDPVDASEIILELETLAAPGMA